MRFELEGKLTFSKELGSAREDVENLLRNPGDIPTRGAPKGKEGEAGRITGWEIGESEVRVKIESGRYVRAHDVLLRLAKSFAEILGRKHKIGVRMIGVSKYTITVPTGPIQERALEELRKLGCEISEEAVKISLEDLSESEIRGRVVDRLVSTIEGILSAPAPREEEFRVVRQSVSRKPKFRGDPFEVAKELGWVVEFPGRGQWIYQKAYSTLLRALEDLIIQKVAKPLGFEEVMFPKLIPLEVMQRMPGYLDGVPEGMYYVCPPPRDPESFSEFKQRLRLTKAPPADELRRVLKDPAYVLAPAQCEPFYQQFSRQMVKLEDLPIKQFDRSGWTYRWEGGGVEGLVRTQEFRRIEFVMLGAPEDVVALRNEVLEGSIKLLDKLELEWRVTEATPFYMREGGIGETEDPAKVATYDLEVRLPYKDGWLEIGSYNVHRTKFTESFRIKEAKEREVWTGCCGFGTSRWVVGFLAQHGFEVESWPKPVRELLGR
jgi:seryl-tRNA synthetase